MTRTGTVLLLLLAACVGGGESGPGTTGSRHEETAGSPAETVDPPGDTAAGSTAAVREAVLGRPVALAVGEAVAYPAESLLVRFDGVENDSRCPVDVVCVTLGNARARFRVRLSDGAEEVLLLNSSNDPREGTAKGYRVRLESLAPLRYSERSIEPNEYRAEIVLERA